MKKIFFAAVAVALTMASCGNQTKSASQLVDSDSIAAAVDTAAVAANSAEAVVSLLNNQLTEKNGTDLTKTLTSLQTKYAELVKGGKLEEGKKYAQVVKQFVEEHADQIKSVVGDNATVNTLISGIKSLPTDAATTANEAVNAAKTGAENAAKNVEAAKESAKKKANEVVESAKETAKQKAGEAASKAAGDAMKKLGL
uniref:Lipoprotein n=1 Tax=Prevotella sp. GTC17254 TaxID=3236794 RepID=A0AB33J543_9BACT